MPEDNPSGINVWSNPNWAATSGATGLLMPTADGPPLLVDRLTSPATALRAWSVYGRTPLYTGVLIGAQFFNQHDNPRHRYIVEPGSGKFRRTLLLFDLDRSRQRSTEYLHLMDMGQDPRRNGALQDEVFRLDVKVMADDLTGRYDFTVGRPWRVRIKQNRWTSTDTDNPERITGLEDRPELVQEILAIQAPSARTSLQLDSARFEIEQGRAPSGATAVPMPELWLTAAHLQVQCHQLRAEVENRVEREFGELGWDM